MIPERRGENRPFASLTSGLLARKGQAKPAMKPQGYGMGMSSAALEDLGWNDMGFAAAPPRTTPRAVPMPEAHTAIEAPVAPPPVVQQQVEIEQALNAAGPAIPTDEQAVPPVKAATAPRKMRVAATKPAPVSRTKAVGKTKAAFTLRLDPERHLKLRLACAVSHRSAQAIVTEALDDMLAAIPGIDALAKAAPERTPG